jgi:hypothetical protein
VSRYFIQKRTQAPLGFAKKAPIRTYWVDAMLDCNLNGIRHLDQAQTQLTWAEERADEDEIFRLIKRTNIITAEVVE